MSLNIDDFKAKLIGGGARPNLFRVTCNFPSFTGGNSEFASFMIKTAQLPASTIGAITVPFRGRQIKVAGNRIFEDMSITVINDESFKIRTSFEKWLNGINNHVDNTGLSNPADYQSDITIDQLNKNGDVIKSYILRGAFPLTLGAIELSNESTDTIEEYSVSLAYQYWTSKGSTD